MRRDVGHHATVIPAAVSILPVKMDTDGDRPCVVFPHGEPKKV